MEKLIPVLLCYAHNHFHKLTAYDGKEIPHYGTTKIQESMDHIISGLHGVISIADDVCSFGENEKDHVNMHKFMEKEVEMG